MTSRRKYLIAFIASCYSITCSAQSDSISVGKDSIKMGSTADSTSIVSTQKVDSLRILLVDTLLNYATTHLGKPYRGGAKGPNAFDCSGFTNHVFSKFGYQLSSSSASQYTEGIKVDYKDVRKGDLVFFTGRNARSGVVGHVGIVYDIDPLNEAFYFIHASCSEGIKIDVFPDKYYYYKRFIGIKRIIVDEEIANITPYIIRKDEENKAVTQPKEEKKETLKKEENQEAKKEIYKVKKGDNLFRIAKSHGCKIEQIMEWNNMKNDKLSIDQELIIYH